MVFIEQPVGVGFSVANGKLSYGDDQAAQDNYNFVVGFFERFKMLKQNKFYITSESYGGHYMPTLADAIVSGGGVPQFGGFMVGNPLTYMPYRDYGEFGTFAGHNLLPKPMWDKYLAGNCSAVPPYKPDPSCAALQKQMENVTSDMDGYALDFPKCQAGVLGTASTRHQAWAMRKTIRRAHAYQEQQQPQQRETTADGSSGAQEYPYFPTKYEPCSSEFAATFLSRPDVMTAIHAEPGGPTWTGNWSACSDAVGNAFSAADTIKPMMPVYSRA